MNEKTKMIQPEWCDLPTSTNAQMQKPQKSEGKTLSAAALEVQRILEFGQHKIGMKRSGAGKQTSGAARKRQDEPQQRSREEEVLALMGNKGDLIQQMSTEDILRLARTSKFMNSALAPFIRSRAESAKAFYRYFASSDRPEDVPFDSPIFYRMNAMKVAALCSYYGEEELEDLVLQNGNVDMQLYRNVENRFSDPERAFHRLESLPEIPGQRFRGYTHFYETATDAENTGVYSTTLIMPADAEENGDFFEWYKNIHVDRGFDTNYYGKKGRSIIWGSHVEYFVTEGRTIGEVVSICEGRTSTRMEMIRDGYVEMMKEDDSDFDEDDASTPYRISEDFFYMRTIRGVEDEVNEALTNLQMDIEDREELMKEASCVAYQLGGDL